MDEFAIPSTAHLDGSLLRAYEYRATDVHSPPHLRWSFALKDKAMVFSILIAENVVYVGDSAGFFSAIDARSGTLLWRFATDWVARDKKRSQPNQRVGVTAICLAGTVGYVADAQDTLYELDSKTGQALRSWNREALLQNPEQGMIDQIFSLCLYEQWVLISGLNHGLDATWCFDRVTGNVAPEPIPFGGPRPIIARPSESEADVFYGFCMISHTGQEALFAADLSHVGLLSASDSWAQTSVPAPVLWGVGGEDDEEVGILSPDHVLITDGLLFAFEQRDYYPDDPYDEEDEERTLASVLALDPSSGAVHWRYACPDDYQPLHLDVAYHLLFLVDENSVEAIDIQTQQRRWKWDADAECKGALIEIADGLLIVPGTAGHITVLDAHTGTPRGHWQVEGEMDRCTIDNGMLFIVTAPSVPRKASEKTT